MTNAPIRIRRQPLAQDADYPFPWEYIVQGTSPDAEPFDYGAVETQARALECALEALQSRDARPHGEPLPCGCIPHVVYMSRWGFRCETEDQPYCNFECPHEEAHQR